MTYQAPGAMPPVPPPARVTPPGWWFGVGALLIVIGIVGGIGLGVATFAGLSSKVDDFQRVPVPGAGAVRLETGSYTVYLEGATGSSGKLLITDPDGARVTLTRYTSEITYSFNKHSGEAKFSFEAPKSGEYKVETAGEPGATVAIGHGLGGGIVGGVLGALGVGLVGLFAGLAVLITVGVKRGRSRRALAGPNWGGQPSWPPPPGQAPPSHAPVEY
ncbi:MAG: hypothetical protein HOQ24_10685 [Mycobacteriaceae bacterium]|nr:hypothetical protein [Mycobacteriaceae bacterium]